MPSVPTYGGRRVARSAIPGVRRQQTETFESAGGRAALAQRDLANTQGELARTRGRKAETQAEIAGGVARLGAGLLVEEFQRERDRADQVMMLTSLRQLNELDHAVLRDPDNGILNKRGLAAMEARDQALEAWDTRASEIAGALKNDRQQLAFEQQRVGRRARLIEEIDGHGSSELRRHEENEFKALLDSSQQRAATYALNPPQIVESLTEQAAAISAFATRNGLGQEMTAAMVADARNKTWSGAIAAALVAGKDRVAKTYLEEARDAGQLTGDSLVRMTEAVKKGATDADGERLAADIWATHAPATDADPISLDKLEQLARERAGDDVDMAKTAIAALRTRKQATDDARRERKGAAQTALWGAVLEGKSYDEIRLLPHAVSDPQELRQVRDYLDSRAYQQESRAYQAEQREFTREQRDLTRAQRALVAEERLERQRELRGWAEYFELRQPDVVRGLSHGDIVSRLPTLGTAHVQRLLGDKERVMKDDATYRAAVVDDDVFKEVANAAGLAYVYRTPASLSDVEKANLGKLRALVEDEIGRQQVGKNRRLTRDETRQLMQSLVDQKVLVKDSGWFFADDPAIAAIVNEKDRARAYVPIDQIPPAAVGEALNYLRSLNPRVSDQQLRTRYLDRIQRAYALTLMRGSRADVEAVLKGER